MVYITDKWEGQEFFSIKTIKYIEFFVGNAKQAVHFYRSIFGLKPLAYSGPETGICSHVSYVLRKDKIHFIFTTPLISSHYSSEWLKKHGDGVRDIAFSVENVYDSHESCLKRGAQEENSPSTIKNEDGIYTKSSIKTYGETIHSLIDDQQYNGYWAPGFLELNLPSISVPETHLVAIDHVVGNVEENKMDYWRDYYEKVFGFSTFVKFDEGDISTQFSALKSIVLRSKNWKVRLPINEPAKGLKKSQIEEYLDFNEGPGVQHIAILSDDIIASIKALRSNGLEFLEVPETYYQTLKERVGNIDEDIEKLKKLKILVDRDEYGYLLQLFTIPVEVRPTLFIEIIQRKGSKGFGQGNFQALFEAIESAQSERGNL